MRSRTNLLVVLIILPILLLQTFTVGKACGPESITPIFSFTYSPDLPFDEFANGKIGVLQPTLGRKSLVIAYRYLRGGSFNPEEQKGLVIALTGKAPEDADDNTAIKNWIAARKEVLGDQASILPIYDERRRENRGYDFFPNCTQNAFEVATETLKNRAASYGSQDPNVRDWLDAQDVVFKNCAEGAESPRPAGPSSPRWLQKDRDYQTAAAYFYSLNFKEARIRFTAIAADSDSDWQETARYLVGRTIVREASLAGDENQAIILYQQAEAELLNILASGGKFQNAAKRLLALVKFRLRPEERVTELGQILAEQSGNDNVRQDLIDYKWLLDRLEARAIEEEEKRKQALNPTPTPTPYETDREYQARYEAVQRGELIEFYFTPKNEKGEADYQRGTTLTFKSDVTETEVLQKVETDLGRKLNDVELKLLKENFASALSRREWLLSPNRKVDIGNDYVGCSYDCEQLPLRRLPASLRADELSDWIFTSQSEDPRAYDHAVARWRQTQSHAWLAVALNKANVTSRGVLRLQREAEAIEKDATVYATVAYNLIRLRMESSRVVEARRLFDEDLVNRLDQLPATSQNLLLAQRMKMATTVGEFLKFASRKPAAFSEYGTIGRITDLLTMDKSLYDPTYNKETKEEYDRNAEERFKQFMPWDERRAFDYDSADILNWHFSLKALLEASRDPSLPDYLQKSMALAVWTRAVILKNHVVAREVAHDVVRLAPEMATVMKGYLDATTPQQREDESLFVLLKFPNLSPYVPFGVPEFSTPEESEYYFELSWWCKQSDTEWNDKGDEVPKVVPNPKFLPLSITSAAKRERAALVAIGDAKSYLGKRALEWSRRVPNDPRVPEALFIGFNANLSYKYGCGSWEQDEETRTAIVKLLRERYPQSPWTQKLPAEE